ncbi:MAG: ABC transporter permease subunit [Candidatus Pacebacteria bacterium]|nr:ABC transporter permease subunit [Candidatus Paceibacterota bacterium]
MSDTKSNHSFAWSKKAAHLGFLSSLLFFVVVIFIPAVYILGYFGNFDALLDPEIIRALFLSLSIGLIVTIFNLILGVPLAWMIVRSKNRFLKWLDNLIDLSLVMPTAALGFSVYFYYGTNWGVARLIGLEGGLVSQGPLLIILLHIVFTLPYMVRSVSAAIMQLDVAYEEAADSLGASPFSFFRTIALPLCRDGVINGAVLSFTRSLSETGATMMVAGVFATAPVLIVSLKDADNFPAAASLSIILILIALLILVLARTAFGKKTFTLPTIRPDFEKKLSGLFSPRNFIVTFVYFAMIFLPTIFLVLYYFMNFKAVDISALTGSLLISFAVAGIVTLFNAFLALPIAYIIARNRMGIGEIVESLNEVILIVPTSALGLSLALFWRQFLPWEIVILILAHLCFTFPLFVKPLVAAFRNISTDQEDAAYSLGAGTVRIFRTVILPQIKPALITGAIMVFMRSLSETGATLAVSQNIKTVSVLIVELFKENRLDEAAIACLILFSFSLVFLVILKKTQTARTVKRV